LTTWGPFCIQPDSLTKRLVDMGCSVKRQETTERIISAAMAVFSRDGFNGARVDEIAREAGVNKATLYYHVGDKEAL